LMRIGRNEKWYQAHKSHAYQRLVQLGMSHKKLVIVILIVNVSILWPSINLQNKRYKMPAPALDRQPMPAATKWKH